MINGRSEQLSGAWHMHALEAPCLCETVVSVVATKGNDNRSRAQQVCGPVGPHLAEAFSQNAPGLSIVDHQIQATRNSDRDSCRFTVPKCISRGRSYDREKEIKLRTFQRED